MKGYGVLEENSKPDLKKLRREHNWSQKLASEQIGISRSYLAMVEEGKRVPSVAAAKKIAEIFRIEWHTLFEPAAGNQ